MTSLKSSGLVWDIQENSKCAIKNIGLLETKKIGLKLCSAGIEVHI